MAGSGSGHDPGVLAGSRANSAPTGSQAPATDAAADAGSSGCRSIAWAAVRSAEPIMPSTTAVCSRCSRVKVLCCQP